MVLRSKRDYLEAISSRYRRAGKRAKTIILDKFCENCGYNRKYAIRLLRKLNKRPSDKTGKRPGPKTIYHEAKLLEALKRIWFATDQMFSKKLKVAIPPLSPVLREGIRAFGKSLEKEAVASKPGNHRSIAQTIQGTLQKRTLHHQARNVAQKSDPRQYPSLGCHAPRLLRGRHGSPLRQLHGRGLRLQPHLYRYPQRMDRKQGGMGQRLTGGAEKN